MTVAGRMSCQSLGYCPKAAEMPTGMDFLDSEVMKVTATSTSFQARMKE